MSAAEFLQDLTQRIREGDCDYTVNGECSGCGECCSDFLPMAGREIAAIRHYIQTHKIKEQKHFIPSRNPVYDMACPFRDNGKRRCVIYHVRPFICRAYRCDKFKRGEPMDGAHYDGQTVRIVSVRQTFFGG